jgi:hypothetical protein
MPPSLSAFGCCGGLQAIDQRARFLAERFVEAGLCNFLQRGEATCRGHRIARQRAGLVDRA